MKATVFLGGGRITAALLAGLHGARDSRPVLVYDRHPEKLRRLRRHYGVAIEPDLQRAIAQARLVIIAVRPSSVADLLRNIGNLEPSSVGCQPRGWHIALQTSCATGTACWMGAGHAESSVPQPARSDCLGL
jgi:NADP oxidoreductase coenzyme F420-dependent